GEVLTWVMPEIRMNSLRSLAMNCGPLSEMIRRRAAFRSPPRPQRRAHRRGPLGHVAGRRRLHRALRHRARKEIAIHGLNTEATYYFAVDAFNDSGRTQGTPVLARRRQLPARLGPVGK